MGAGVCVGLGLSLPSPCLPYTAFRIVLILPSLTFLLCQAGSSRAGPRICIFSLYHLPGAIHRNPGETSVMACAICCGSVVRSRRSRRAPV